MESYLIISLVFIFISSLVAHIIIKKIFKYEVVFLKILLSVATASVLSGLSFSASMYVGLFLGYFGYFVLPSGVFIASLYYMLKKVAPQISGNQVFVLCLSMSIVIMVIVFFVFVPIINSQFY